MSPTVFRVKGHEIQKIVEKKKDEIIGEWKKYFGKR